MVKLSNVPGIPAPPMEKKADPKKFDYRDYIRTEYDVSPEQVAADAGQRSKKFWAPIGTGAAGFAGGAGAVALALRQLGKRMGGKTVFNAPIEAYQAIRASHPAAQVARMSPLYKDTLTKTLTDLVRPKPEGFVGKLFGAGAKVPKVTSQKARLSELGFLSLTGKRADPMIADAFRRIRASVPKSQGIRKLLKNMPWKGKAALVGLPLLLGTGGYLLGRE